MTTTVDATRSDFNVSQEISLQFPHDADILLRDHAGQDELMLMTTNNTAFAVQLLPTVTLGWHVKATANFDNSDADILWQNDNGALVLWQMGDAVRHIQTLPNPGPAWHVVGDNDFNLDGADDIFFQHDSGALAIWTGISPATGTVAGIFAGTQNPGPT